MREKINEYLNLLTIFNNRQHQGRVNEKLIIVKIFTKHVRSVSFSCRHSLYLI